MSAETTSRNDGAVNIVTTTYSNDVGESVHLTHLEPQRWLVVVEEDNPDGGGLRTRTKYDGPDEEKARRIFDREKLRHPDLDD